MSYALPFPIPPGQGVAWALPTVVQFGHAQDGASLTNGSAVADLTSGTVTMNHSSGTGTWIWYAWWKNFSAPSLPLNASIHSIYAVAEAKAWDPTTVYNSSFEICGGSSIDPTTITVIPAFNGPTGATSEPSTFGTYYKTSSLGTSISNAISIYARFFQTLNLTGDGHLVVSAPRLAIYYDAPVMPIGHGANCNAYDPISVEDGATTPPGNGLLISL